MASTIYPGKTPFSDNSDEVGVQTEKCMTIPGNTKATFENGYIIAKGNIIEGIEAKI